MALSNDLTTEVANILNTSWSVRNGNVVPETEDVALKDGAVKIEATFLYADLAGSSKLAQLCPWITTAKIIRAYLNCTTRLIRHYGGEIRSFDGDRVMGVFIGESKNTNAVKCALAIDWVVSEVISPKSKRFNSIKDNNIEIKHCVGIDSGECRAVRSGIRNNNDLIWIGKPPSFAAKLSDIRKYPYEIFISKAVYNKMNNAVTYANKDGSNMWVADTTSFAGNIESIYKSTWWRKPS